MHSFERPIAGAAIRRPVLQGRRPVAGLWLPSDWFDEAERARRMLAAWRTGSTALRFPQGDLLRYPAPAPQPCDTLSGWPLHLEGRTLCSAPLDDAERERLPAADAWIVLGGNVLALQFSQAVTLEPALWLSLQGPALHDPYDCRDALPEPVVLAPGARSMRDVLGGKVPLASAEQAAFRDALLRASRQGNAPSGAVKASGSEPSWSRLQDRPVGLRKVFWVAALAAVSVVFPPLLRDLLNAIVDGQGFTILLWLAISGTVIWAGHRLAGTMLRRAHTWSRSRPEDGPGSSPASNAAKPSTTVPTRRLRATPQRWREWLARLAYSTQLGRLMGRQHAAYMRRMLELFDRGDLEEALRHAVPLGDSATGSLGQAFGALGPRRDLRLSSSLSPSTSLDFGTSLQEHLRQIYRRTFERLDRDGRIDEAVFVLAELLSSRQEALDYLEKHERYAQAAELALAWDRPADAIVRLHCLAGDWQRAVAVARRDAAFANAVLQLEKKWPDAAHRLRGEWGESLAQQGEWLAAVDAVWPAKSWRGKAGEWLQAAEAAGGELAARALVQRALLLPDTMGVHAARLQALRDDRALRRERCALAHALLDAASHGEASRALTAAVAGAVIADQAEGDGRFDKTRLQRLVTLSGDALLQTDLPRGDWPSPQPRSLAAREQPLECDAPAAGVHDIFDAVPLEDRRYLVALGEAGVVMVDAQGRTITRFAVPAQRLVVAGSRRVTLALARRDRVWRVSRLDLVQRRVTDLGQCELDAFATEFDGIGWTVGRGSRLQVLDAGRSLQDVLWQVADLPGSVLAIQTSGQMEQALVSAGQGDQSLWRYQLPQRRLLSRDGVPPSDIEGMALLHPDHGVVKWNCVNARPGVSQVSWTYSGKTHELSLAGDDVVAAGLGSNDWLLFSAGPVPESLCFAGLHQGRIGAVVRWPRARDASARCCNESWLLFDRHGRLLHLDTSSSEVTHLTLR